jgi:hypothetical protein
VYLNKQKELTELEIKLYAETKALLITILDNLTLEQRLKLKGYIIGDYGGFSTNDNNSWFEITGNLDSDGFYTIACGVKKHYVKTEELTFIEQQNLIAHILTKIIN